MGQTQIQVTVHVFGRAPRHSRGCGPGPGPGTVRLSPPRRSSSERAAQGPQRRQCPPGAPRLARVQCLTTSPPLLHPPPPAPSLEGLRDDPSTSAPSAASRWASFHAGVQLCTLRAQLAARHSQASYRGLPRLACQAGSTGGPSPASLARDRTPASRGHFASAPCVRPSHQSRIRAWRPSELWGPLHAAPPVHLAVFSPLTSRGRALAVFEDCGARFQVLLTLPGLTAHHSMSSSLDVQ